MKECPACKHCFIDEFNNCPTDGEVLVFSIRGDTVLDGRYQLEWRLGQGGMGIVFKASHIFLKAPYAIKVILPDLVGNDPKLVTRFRQEAMLSARIRHRNIVNVTDFGVANGAMPYLVMDFVQGKSLQDLLTKEVRVSPQRALEIMSAICAGVGAAHQQDVVHRDLKPLNIMIQDDQPFSEGVKVLDFGLAKIKSGELLGSFVAAQSTGLMGSPFYMAPELWSDEEPDKTVDIYSMGVILFQIIAGDVPFNGNSIPAIMKKHLTDPPPSFSQFGVNVPPAIESVVAHALEKKPQARPASVAEFLRELGDAVASCSGSISHPGIERRRPGADTNPTGGSTGIGQSSWEQTLTDSQRGIADEADRLRLEFEEAQRRADEARRRAEEAAIRRAEEETARRRAEAEAARKQAEEEAARKRAEEAARRQIEEETARRFAEQEAARQRAEEEARKIAAEHAERIRVAEEAARLAQEVVEAQERATEARLRADEEARRRTEEAFARRRAEEDARRLTQEVAEAQGRAEEARERAEEEARRRAEEEHARKQAEELLTNELAREAARKQAEEEIARRQAAEEADRLGREVLAAKQRAEEAGQRAEAEAHKRAEEEEARKRAETEARRLALEMAEVQRRAEEARQRVEAESAERAEQEARKRVAAEEARNRAEEESRRLTREIAAAHSQEARDLAEARRLAATSGAGATTSEQPSGSVAPAVGLSSLGGVGLQSGPVSRGHAGPSFGTLSLSGDAATKNKAAIWIIFGIVLLLGVIVIGVGITAYVFVGPAAKSTPSPGVPTPAPTPNGPNLVTVQGGTFQLGRNDVDMNSNEGYDYSQYPPRSILVRTFMMDKTEVTNAEYADFLSAGGGKRAAPSSWSNGKPPADQLQWPVTYVNVDDANAFADWRSKRDKVKYRLPTEEEWEYAARNGSEDNFYPWGNDFSPGRANVDGNAATAVGSHPKGASHAGVMDLIGNVWELTGTRAAPYPGGKPLSDIQGKYVIRGGCYSVPSTGASAITSTRRSFVAASNKAAEVGFRLVVAAP